MARLLKFVLSTVVLGSLLSILLIIPKVQCKFKRSLDDLPSLIVQYGSPRTATTFQTIIVCLSMFIRLNEYNRGNQLSCRFEPRNPDEKEVKTKWTVLKEHHVPSRVGNEWMFTTANPLIPLTNHTKTILAEGFDLKYVANMREVERLGYLVAWDYQHIFKLRDSEMEQVAAFLRFWDIIRLCCGMQMSEIWREQMLQAAYKRPRNYDASRHSNNTKEYFPACNIYDIDEVVSVFLNSSLAKQIRPHDVSKYLLRASGSDGELTQHYCSDYNKDVVRYNLTFNARVIDGVIRHGNIAT